MLFCLFAPTTARYLFPEKEAGFLFLLARKVGEPISPSLDAIKL